MSIAARSRRLVARTLALALAAGLAGLLVGLSAAPSKLPGDTLHVTPRSAAGALVAVSQPNDPAIHPSFGDAYRMLIGGLIAVVPVPLGLVAGGGVVVAQQCWLSFAAPSLLTVGCRGPPATMTS